MEETDYTIINRTNLREYTAEELWEKFDMVPFKKKRGSKYVPIFDPSNEAYIAYRCVKTDG